MTIIKDIVNIKIRLVSVIDRQICLGKIGIKLLIFPVRVHIAIAIITPAKTSIITSLKFQTNKLAVTKAIKFSQLENFNLLISLNSPFHY